MLQNLNISNKNKYSNKIEQKILLDSDINKIKYTVNEIVDYINNFSIPVSSVNGQTGDVILKFPVTSVNGQTGDVQIDFPVSSVNGQTGDVKLDFPVLSVNGLTGHVNLDFPVSSVNGLTGNVILKMSNIDNDMNFITNEDIPVSSVNGLTGHVELTMKDLQNDVGYITSNAIPVSSVNGLTGDVQIDFPVLSVNGLTGHVNLNFPVSSVNGLTGDVVLSTSIIENDSGYITLDDLPISSVTAIHTSKSDEILTGNAKIFVPNKISQVENDENYYNNLSSFIKIINSTDDLSTAQSGYLYCILQEDD